MARELYNQLAQDPDGTRLATVANKISQVSDPGEVTETVRSLICVPLPLPMFAGISRTQGPSAPRGEPQKKPPAVAVAFTSFMLDGVRFSEPHTIQPQVMHDLTVKAAISRWPEGAEELVLEPVSVEPQASYELPSFSFSRPAGEPPYEVSKSGRMLLPWPQTFFARPLEFAYRARFSPPLTGVELLVQGQRHLRVQCYDPDLSPQSGYAEVDRRLLELRAEARALPGVADPESNDFLVFWAQVGGIASRSVQDNIFPRVYSEADFQREVKGLLRNHPRIGPELEEHPTAGGGVTDLSFRRIRLELKALSDRAVAREDADQFVQQAAQYAVGSDRRFGLLAILDSSPKTKAPGPVANDIFLKVVPPPTGRTLPVCLGTVLIRGNLARPSSLSKTRPE